MKVVIIADNLGNNAPGTVFRNLLSGLSGKLDFDLITSTMDYKWVESHKGKLFKINQNYILSWRIRTFLFIIFGYYHTQKKWAEKVQKILDDGDYDIVVSYMSSTFYASVMAAKMYADRRSVRHICYCVDAVPAPYPWEKKGIYSFAMRRFVRNNLQNVDRLCMTNKEMLDYELKIIGRKNIKPIVLPNPPKESRLQYLEQEDVMPYFAYAGKMYGVRNPNALLAGFKLFLTKHPDAKIVFIGSGNLEYYIHSHYKELINNIDFISYTNDLVPYFQKCMALIDVNANIDNDVFLSSKIISYLPYNRLIISESGNGSPVRSIFKYSKTILHVTHNANDYCDAMEYCYNNYKTVDFYERKEYLACMGIDAATKILINNIQNNEN